LSTIVVVVLAACCLLHVVVDLRFYVLYGGFEVNQSRSGTTRAQTKAAGVATARKQALRWQQEGAAADIVQGAAAADIVQGAARKQEL
jgi:hypothetical protein